MLKKNPALLIKPKRLSPGDTIGIVAPASSFDAGNFKSGVAFLRQLGYKVKYEHSIFNPCWSKPGHDRQRALQINHMFADPLIKAIFCAKAGYGSAKIIPFLDKKIIRNNPKIFIGYSDITILLLYLQRIANMVIFHGPVVSDEIYAGMNQQTHDFLFRLVNSPKPIGKLGFKEMVVFKPGQASGILVGGNMSLILESVSTPYRIKTKNSILFLEDINEELDEIDHYLHRLKRLGKFKTVKGIVFGSMVNCFERREDLRTIVNDIFRHRAIPIVFGFPSGHTLRRGYPHITLPLGTRVSLDTKTLSLTIEEPAVS